MSTLKSFYVLGDTKKLIEDCEPLISSGHLPNKIKEDISVLGSILKKSTLVMAFLSVAICAMGIVIPTLGVFENGVISLLDYKSMMMDGSYLSNDLIKGFTPSYELNRPLEAVIDILDGEFIRLAGMTFLIVGLIIGTARKSLTAFGLGVGLSVLTVNAGGICRSLLFDDSHIEGSQIEIRVELSHELNEVELRGLNGVNEYLAKIQTDLEKLKVDEKNVESIVARQYARYLVANKDAGKHVDLGILVEGKIVDSIVGGDDSKNSKAIGNSEEHENLDYRILSANHLLEKEAYVLEMSAYGKVISDKAKSYMASQDKGLKTIAGIKQGCITLSWLLLGLAGCILVGKRQMERRIVRINDEIMKMKGLLDK